MRRAIAILAVTAVVVTTGCGAPGPELDVGEAELGVGKGGVLPSAAELARMKRYVDEHYDRAQVVHRFRSGVGEDIDCIPLAAQPAMRRPEMLGHVIETPPPAPGDAEETAKLEALFGISDELDETGAIRRCPQGSIPIVRLELAQLARFATLEDYLRKGPAGTEMGEPDADAPMEILRTGSTASHQYATGRHVIDNWGGESVFAIYNPYTELTTEFSLSQIWVGGGSGADTQTVEAGWQRYQQKYGDAYARLFIYYTPDNYTTGCYNLDCSAFVQTNSSIVIGSKFSNYSTPGGTIYVQTYRYQKAGTTGSWWLAIGGTNIGYYPRTLFDTAGIADKGGRVTFGGEIVHKVTTRHTLTDMGSGRFPSEGKSYAAYQRNIRYIDLTNTYRTPTLTKSATDAYCYDATVTAGDPSWGTYLLFGGPGYSSPNCL